MDDKNNENVQDEQTYSDEELQKLRSKTFNPELSELINSITGSSENQEADSEEKMKQGEDFPLLKRLNKLLYSFYAQTSADPMEVDCSDDGVYTILEYELQRLGIDHYGIFCYSPDDECFAVIHSVFIEKRYIGIYNPIIQQSVQEGWASDGEYVAVSLSHIYRSQSELFFSHTLMPVFLCKREDWDESTYIKLIYNTSLVGVLAGVALKHSENEPKREIIRHKVHTELVRLQHNYILIPGSVCYIVTSSMATNKNLVTRFNSVADSLESEISNTSVMYRLNDIAVVLFLTDNDIHSAHNRFLLLRGEHPDLLLFDLEDYKGKNFLASVYELLYKRHITRS